jgi:tetratricopeptide (TPR) repeat protein
LPVAVDHPGQEMVRRSPGSDLQEGAAPATELPAHAQRLLAVGDVDGYGGLFKRVESIADPHRRYWAGRSLLEQGLAASASAGAVATRRPALLTALCAGAVELLEHAPSEPRLLEHAAAAMYELGMFEAAEALLEASTRLDPELEDLQRRARELAERRLAHGPLGSAASDRVLAELSRRALQIAALAQPAEGLRLSLCMIVRDEQEMLPRCLAAVADAVDEIVIVDTGSSDATIELARSFGARVIEQAWTGSFAQARNASFDAAHGDWLMYLDADEVLVREDARLLRSLTGRTWREAFYLAQTNYTGDAQEGAAVTHSALRVFRNRPEYRFEGRLHEQIGHRLPAYLPERIESTSIRVEHYGYLGVVRDAREKSARNIELLRLQLEESAPTPFLHYNLGCEHAAAGDSAAALAEFERSEQLLQALPDRDSYQFAPALCSRLVKALRACERPQEALERAEEALQRFPGFTDLLLEQALAAIALARHELAIELCEACIEMGEPPRRYTATAGSGTYLPRLHLADLRRAQGETELAIEQLEHCLREYPQFIGSVLPYASALLANGMDGDAVVDEVERHMPDPGPPARFLLGTALYEGGASAAGEAQFRAVLERQPHSGRARIALAETLLAQRRYAEAASAASVLSSEDPLARIACRSELFARIAGAESAAAAPALARARAAGMAPAELELFSAWQQLASAGRTEIELSSEVVPLLALMLEALLRVHDFEAFEALLGLLAHCPLDARERHELLAEMYMRRGFLASAAEEWMAVCREEPDTSALLGLARVAAATGMSRELGDFAAAALSRDPDNEAAVRLLSQAPAS